MSKFREWLRCVLVGLDVFVNPFIPFAPPPLPGETISHRACRGVELGLQPWKLLCKIIHVFDHKHCAETRF